jgi:hypothetical protein
MRQIERSPQSSGGLHRTAPSSGVRGRRNFLFCVSSLGLGHASRTLPVIRHYLRNHHIHILSSGAALEFLKRELPPGTARFFELDDYPPIERGTGLAHLWFLIGDACRIHRKIAEERAFVERLVTECEIDLVFSDMRYGCQSPRVPSVALCHQIEFVMPRATGFMKPFADRFNRRHLETFSAILVPDFEDESGNLSGRLSHNRLARRLGAEYVGILSSVTPSNAAKDIDYLFILSGYLSEHAEAFIARLIEQAGVLPGKKVFVLGDMTRDELEELPGDITIHSHATGHLRNELLNRARVVVSRSGYTTVMDLVEIGAKGVFIPTPKQTEQEYIASHHGSGSHFIAFGNQHDFDLSDILGRADRLEPFPAAHRTESTLRRIDAVISGLLEQAAP